MTFDLPDSSFLTTFPVSVDEVTQDVIQYLFETFNAMLEGAHCR